MNIKELTDIYKYVDRLPTPDDINAHINKQRDAFTIEMLSCPEYVMNGTDKLKKSKFAMLLCGHIRNNNILSFLKNNTNYDIDIFIFTWENFGIKGNETNIEDKENITDIVHAINSIPNVKKYIIESNKKFINNNILSTNETTYFNYSSPEIFIKSQLYSIAKCYRLMEQHVNETRTKYDLVFKMRFDVEVYNFEIPYNVIVDCNNNDIIFVTNGGVHGHPDNDGGCITCNKMYYTYFLKQVHVFDHSNVICDLFAYGSVKSMKRYCSVYYNYDNYNKSFTEQNLKIIKEKNLDVIKLSNNVYRTNHLDALYYLFCSFPERILYVHLKNYMCIESRYVKCHLHR